MDLGRPDLYTYDHASSLSPGGVWNATVSVDWSISYGVSDGSGGSLGSLTTRSSIAVRVGEIEALVTKPG